MTNCIRTSKLGLRVESVGGIFCGHYYWYTSIESRVIWKFKFLAKNSFKICVFFSSKSKILYVFKEKTNTKWKRMRFYSWALPFFFRFLFFSNVLWSTNMKLYGRKKIAHYVVYIIFIQSSSSNCWIEIHFDLKWNLNSKMLLCTF